MADSSNPPQVSLSVEKFAALFGGGSANVRAEQALEALSPKDAVRVPQSYPHSVAAMVAHMQFWQVWLLDRLSGKNPVWPEHAADGWPNVSEADWEALHTDFFTDLVALEKVAHDPEALNHEAFDGQSTAEALLDCASHNVYHLGQIVTVRRSLGLWPPPSGGDS